MDDSSVTSRDDDALCLPLRMGGACSTERVTVYQYTKYFMKGATVLPEDFKRRDCTGIVNKASCVVARL